MSKLEEAAKAYASCEVSEGGLAGICGIEAGKYEPFIAGAQWQAKQSPWISVEERMPKDGERVWVKCNRFNNLPLFHIAGRFRTSLKGGYYDDSVTHWMPIPE